MPVLDKEFKKGLKAARLWIPWRVTLSSTGHFFMSTFDDTLMMATGQGSLLSPQSLFVMGVHAARSEMANVYTGKSLCSLL